MKTKFKRHIGFFLVMLCLMTVLSSSGIFFVAGISYTGEAPQIKNVIYMIGDGMGFKHLEAAKIKRNKGEKLNIEKMAYGGEIVTRSLTTIINSDKPDTMFTDSAAAGTALATGQKTLNDTVGQNFDGSFIYTNILEAAKAEGMKTAVISSKPSDDATPAAFSAHASLRHAYDSIFSQQMSYNHDIIVGGTADKTGTGNRKFVEGFDDTAIETNGYSYCNGLAAFENANADKLYGRFNGLKDTDSQIGDTGLARVTKKSIDTLNKANTNGFVMMIEGGAIDDYSHENQMDSMVEQLIRFDLAVKEAVEFAKKDGNTLVIVTADHETGGLTLPANPTVGNVTNSCFTRGTHSNANVPLFAEGLRAERLIPSNRAIENTHITKFIASELALKLDDDIIADNTAKIIKLDKSGELGQKISPADKKIAVATDKTVQLTTQDLQAVKNNGVEYLDLRHASFIGDIIPENAFKGFGALRTVYLPFMTKKISSGAFENSGIENVIMPPPMEEIGQNAFNNCANLQKITMPFMLRRIDSRAFYNTSLQRVVFTDIVPHVLGEEIFSNQVNFYVRNDHVSLFNNGALKIYAKNIFVNRNEDKFVNLTLMQSKIDEPSMAILNSVTSKNLKLITNSVAQGVVIATSSFEKIKAVKPIKLDLSHSMTSADSIVENAFNSANTLQKIVLPKNLKEIRKAAFKGTDIEKIEIPKGVTLIGDDAFAACQKLFEVTLNGNPASLGKNVFEQYNLSFIRFNLPLGAENAYSQNSDWKSVLGESVYESVNVPTDGSLNLSKVTSKNIKLFTQAGYSLSANDIAKIKAFQPQRLNLSECNFTGNAFPASMFYTDKNTSNDTLVELILPKTLTSIANDALRNCISLGKIELFDNIESIGSGAIRNTKISKIDLPQNLKTIDYWGLADNANLREIIFKENVQSLGHNVLQNDTSLKNIVIDSATPFNLGVNASESHFPTNIGVKIFVPKGSGSAFKTSVDANKNWARYSDFISEKTGSLSVSGGRPIGSVFGGSTVCLVPDEAPDGKRFLSWDCSDSGVNIVNNSFVMPNKDVIISAVYEDTLYDIRIGGRLFASAAAGDKVVLNDRYLAEKGKMVVEWKSQDISAVNNAFTMPNRHVSLIAVYGDIIYNISITGGTFKGEAIEGCVITLEIGEAPKGKRFVRWQTNVDGLTITDNSFIMPNKDVAITAVYENIPMPAYAVVLICAGAAVFVAGAVALTLLLIKRRKKA